jgi:hypothetical protein
MRVIKLSVDVQSGIMLSAFKLPVLLLLMSQALMLLCQMSWHPSQPDGLGLGNSNCTCYLQILTISKVG